MFCAGEVKGPYAVDAQSYVTDGQYRGELVSNCNGYSGSGVIADGEALPPETMVALRNRFNIGHDRLFLDASAQREGAACIYVQDAADMHKYLRKLDSSDFGENAWTYTWRKYTPFVDISLTEKFERSIRDRLPPEMPGAVEKVWDGLLIGAGFAASALIINSGWAWLTGRSILERILEKNHNDKQDPPSGGAGAGGSAAVGVAAAATAAAATTAERVATESSVWNTAGMLIGGAGLLIAGSVLFLGGGAGTAGSAGTATPVTAPAMMWGAGLVTAGVAMMMSPFAAEESVPEQVPGSI